MSEVSIRGHKGLKSVKDLPFRQDGPPPGGYPPIRYAKRIPSAGPSGLALVIGSCAVMAFGFYRVGMQNRETRALKEEKVDARAAIYPFIQAENDLRYAEAHRKALEEEARIMSRVPGWVVGESVYNSKRWMPPATGRLVNPA